MKRPKERVHAISVRPHPDLGWMWELIDPDGVIVEHGKAWTYSEAIGRAWAAERAVRLAKRELEPRGPQRRAVG